MNMIMTKRIQILMRKYIQSHTFLDSIENNHINNCIDCYTSIKTGLRFFVANMGVLSPGSKGSSSSKISLHSSGSQWCAGQMFVPSRQIMLCSWHQTRIFQTSAFHAPCSLVLGLNRLLLCLSSTTICLHFFQTFPKAIFEFLIINFY